MKPNRCNPIVTFAISTHNRRDVLRDTLLHLRACGLAQGYFETIVVDNASIDGTAAMIRMQFPNARCIALNENLGSCAKNLAVEQARGHYIIFLDDDSHPLPGSVPNMIRHFETDPHLGAAVFTVHLSDGSRECSAYPDVFIGCGTGFRTETLRQVGGLPGDFFMQAEEYDLSLRLLDAGWSVQTFDDLHVMHLKTPTARRSWRTMRLDVRNNLMVAAKYFPAKWAGTFIRDWMSRYYRIAAAKGQRLAFLTGIIQGITKCMQPGFRRPIDPEVFEQFTRMRRIENAMRRLNARTVLFIDYGKNILPYWMATTKLGIQVVAIADNRLAGQGSYHGIPIITDEAAKNLPFDAAIISNSSPVHAQARLQQWRDADPRPVIDLLASPRAAKARSTSVPRALAA